MKNTIKKLFSMLVSALMVMFLATPVLADNDPTITAPANNRTYAVYQIFTGDLANGKLSNVKWGQNGTGTVGEAVPEATLTAVAAIDGTAAEKATAIAAYVNLNSDPIGTVTNGSSISVPTGYYLIKDNGPVADGEGYSLYVVEVVDSVTIAPKTGTTSSEKKVKDDEGANTGWNDSADYDIGDAVPFQLKATVASDYDNYKNGYKLTFHDKESAGLTFNKDSVKVYVDGNEITTGFTVTAPAADGDTFDVAFADLKDIAAVHAGSAITVEYTSTLNENAEIGAKGNPNTSHITYTNNPNDTQAGENGRTPDDTVIVFTYKLVVNKYANSVADDNKLAGAEFTLTKDNKTIAVVKNDA
ncbi:MAG: isopeptide-forming domain-containing fimbrial protein, partial [Firmicutes bacterium]|nr:isopeptide-forming domain-containing fimbrial protein [Bacillota bacterium]